MNYAINFKVSKELVLTMEQSKTTIQEHSVPEIITLVVQVTI